MARRWHKLQRCQVLHSAVALVLTRAIPDEPAARDKKSPASLLQENSRIHTHK